MSAGTHVRKHPKHFNGQSFDFHNFILECAIRDRRHLLAEDGELSDEVVDQTLAEIRCMRARMK